MEAFEGQRYSRRGILNTIVLASQKLLVQSSWTADNMQPASVILIWRSDVTQILLLFSRPVMSFRIRA